ncbi:Retrovirus-related Pol polyprotein from transposon TNT 1-94 [Vitis vinifera]|uniref:Retrovirus-related Pol polyprotein from transposon TNT 1-94 n=1 Tax=Vitis vinifera TaxID=29760 RepID=A0A438IQI4_VITVI|nr:Retrovirus-related Pol polyprotein from transposon TNT 1-94 [Vitis vinifera]
MTKYRMTSSQVSSVTSPESGGRFEIPNLGGSDSSPILIRGHKLNGHNYLQWSQFVLLFICGKGKDEYFTGEAAMPETTKPGFRKWKIENSMIMSWLINSMNNDIGENFLLFRTAKDIWDAAKETYSSSENTSELFQQPAPTLDASALAARSFNSSGGDRQKRDRPWCDYCKKLGHYKEACWKLHVKPADWKPKPWSDRDGRAHVAANSKSTSVPEPSPFNKEQMEMLQKLLSQVGSGSTTRIAFTANRGGMKPWIVDTGASDHMTGDVAILQNYKPSSTSSHVANSQTKSLKQVAYSLKGESMNEHQVWESLLEGVPSFHSESPNPFQSVPTELSTPMSSSVQPAQHTNVPSPELEHGSQSTCGQYIDSNSSLPEENIGEDRVREVLIPSIDDSTLPIALRKGVRRCTDHPIGNYVTYEGLSPSYRAFATSLGDTQVPNTIQEAFKISEWKKVVQDEIDALEKNGTRTIIDLPVGKRPMGCKWIFTIKYKADGSVERFKARLVARGFTQSYGIDYQEIFAPVAKLNTIRILLSLAVNQDCCLQQLDIKNAFLNGDLEEEVYMEIPLGFEESMVKNQVCKLQKSLYGLKQSPRAWFDRFTKAVLKLGYKQG